MALACLRVGDKRASGDRVGEQRDGTRVDTVPAQAADIQPAEIVVSYATDDAGRTPEPAHLIDEEAGAPLGKGPTKVPGARKLWPRPVAMISTRISPIVMIRAIRQLLSGVTPV